MPRNRGTRERVASGIYRDAHGFSIVAVVAGDHSERRFPAGTLLERLQREREKLVAAMHRTRRRGGAEAWHPGRRCPHVPGVRCRHALVPHALPVRAKVGRGLGHGEAGEAHECPGPDASKGVGDGPALPRREGDKDRPPLKSETLRHSLKVLRHDYIVLNGKGTPNPSRDVPVHTPPAPEPRALPRLAIA